MSMAPYPPQCRSSVAAAAAAAAAAATESSIPAGATWNSRASRGARRSRGSAAPPADDAPHARPLPDGVSPRPPPTLQNPARATAQRPAPPPPPSSSATIIITSPAAPLTLTLPKATKPPSALPPLVGPQACPAHLGG
ncbi:hypothetical protein HJG60_011185 [Phyllostomus discolor]|uniref:Uncharacterized protein n=1 Tax=Phyllostomus discolor TaxID=89673 RepID=A0A834E7J4_9CHIR|nr:hypothetical protein HJG60_011185 [Phyllostomus discolor]